MTNNAQQRPMQLFRLRSMLGLTGQQVGEMVDVVPRTVALWEAGTQPMPDSRWELFTLKAARLLERRPELAVVVGPDGNSFLDVVSDVNYFDHVINDDGTALISSFAINRTGGVPYLHTQRFTIAENQHVLTKAAAWKAAQARSAATEDPAHVALHRWLSRRVLHAEARNPKLRELKDAVYAASQTVEQFENAPEEVRRAKHDALNAAIFALIEETGK